MYFTIRDIRNPQQYVYKSLVYWLTCSTCLSTVWVRARVVESGSSGSQSPGSHLGRNRIQESGEVLEALYTVKYNISQLL